MERQKGSGRGSYIYGRSVHNTRIERLWFDWTQGLGLKWYEFFMLLEHSYGLQQENPAHLWLLHHLFLDAVNADAADWVRAWNSHTLQIKGEPNMSPVKMFMFGLLANGPRGLQRQEPELSAEELASYESRLQHQEPELSREELASYGIDYEAQRSTRLMDHLLENNPQDWEDCSPFSAPDSAPEQLSTVECEAPGCPMSSTQVAELDRRLRERVDVNSRDMRVRKLVWQEALKICQQLMSL
ncbi:hypothetical protein B0H11DRAFT_2161268 [Mycena galericulata]|nr:hypothetical protein B0H11DRAFT_2162063 [Mycena galericulata]KAJ7454000.1 hypothetical protein B0H11DRAFT_2161268 [Mycena galericulata]